MLNWPLEATKGQIGGGSLLQIDLYDVYKLCAKFHAFIKKCTKLPVLRLRSSTTNVTGPVKTNQVVTNYVVHKIMNISASALSI